jgi:hypothetical protein
MAKQATTQPKTVAADDRNAATEALMVIVEAALPFRAEGVPSVDLIARLSGTAVRLLKLEQGEATACQNSCVLGLMRKHELIAE